MGIIKYTDIPVDGGSAVSTSTGIVAKTYGGDAVNGRIVKVWYDWEDVASTGSVWLYVSGTDEQILLSKGATADVIAYPRVVQTDNTNTAQVSGNINTEYICRDLPLYIVGSGCGDAKVINKFRVYWY